MKTLLIIVFIALSTTLTPDQAERAEALYSEIRCPVCTAQSVADSDATLSQDIRSRIDMMIAEGRSDETIRDTLSAVYGDDIRLRPRIEPRTWLLWAIPWIVLVLGGVSLFRRNRP